MGDLGNKENIWTFCLVFLMTLSPVMSVCFMGAFISIRESEPALVWPLRRMIQGSNGALRLPCVFWGWRPATHPGKVQLPWTGAIQGQNASLLAGDTILFHVPLFQWEIKIVALASAHFWGRLSHRVLVSLCAHCCLKLTSKGGQTEVRNHCSPQK